MELLQELVWQKLGPWMRRVWWKLESWRRCSLFREREGKPSWLLFCSVHLCPQSLNLPGRQLAREPAWCTFQNTRRLGNECAQLHILALLIFLAQPPLLPPLHTLHFISGNSFQFPATYSVLSGFVHPITPIQKGRKRGHPFAFSQLPEYPQPCFGSQLNYHSSGKFISVPKSELKYP